MAPALVLGGFAPQPAFGLLKLFRTLFGGGQRQATPTPQPTAPMPDPDDPANRAARARRRAQVLGRGGRRSTILTTPESRGEYSDERIG